ncbi:hypothetical protein [Methanolapillus millepedarum]|uniref:Uncharacterized protein n=1 Tax=Methanolapillus millepedarum TaxID=3028296 RepID=A0AA96ZV89_9EURY|nr:hypothetical protein MsAc7_07030 [Methanosarcinaceae archaeon Ac7]
MYYPIPPGSMSEASAIEFLKNHTNDVLLFCRKRAPPGVHDVMLLVKDFLKFAKEKPVDAFEIIYDFIVPNEIKIGWIKKYLFAKPRVINIIGERDSGKNAIVY